MPRHGAYLESAVERSPIGDHVGKSGAALERVVLADGRRLVVKRQSPETDLLMAVIGDSVGREYLMWRRGILDQLPSAVRHAIVDGWTEDGETVIVMRDLGETVLTWDSRLSRGECAAIMRCVGEMHAAFLGRPPADLTPLTVLLGMFAMERQGPYVDGPNPLPRLVLRGWDLFSPRVSADVANPVLALVSDPRPLATALARRSLTLIHGDLATVNMAWHQGQLTMLDWGMPPPRRPQSTWRGSSRVVRRSSTPPARRSSRISG